jgi:hypothetical protein
MWECVAQVTIQWRAFVNTVKIFGFHKGGDFLTILANIRFLRIDINYVIIQFISTTSARNHFPFCEYQTKYF